MATAPTPPYKPTPPAAPVKPQLGKETSGPAPSFPGTQVNTLDTQKDAAAVKSKAETNQPPPIRPEAAKTSEPADQTTVAAQFPLVSTTESQETTAATTGLPAADPAPVAKLSGSVYSLLFILVVLTAVVLLALRLTKAKRSNRTLSPPSEETGSPKPKSSPAKRPSKFEVRI